MRKNECRVSLEGIREGEKGPLTIAMEMFELSGSLLVVEIKKKVGDMAENEEFCNKEQKPGSQSFFYGYVVACAIASVDVANDSALASNFE